VDLSKQDLSAKSLVTFSKKDAKTTVIASPVSPFVPVTVQVSPKTVATPPLKASPKGKDVKLIQNKESENLSKTKITFKKGSVELRTGSPKVVRVGSKLQHEGNNEFMPIFFKSTLSSKHVPKIMSPKKACSLKRIVPKSRKPFAKEVSKAKVVKSDGLRTFKQKEEDNDDKLDRKEITPKNKLAKKSALTDHAGGLRIQKLQDGLPQGGQDEAIKPSDESMLQSKLDTKTKKAQTPKRLIRLNSKGKVQSEEPSIAVLPTATEESKKEPKEDSNELKEKETGPQKGPKALVN